MPLDQSFSTFLQEHRLLHTDDLSKLRGARIAVDAHNWVRLLTPRMAEPFQTVMGGNPLTMDKSIRQELALFRDAQITPIFVFNGLPMILTQSPQQLVQNPFLLEIYEKREAAWQSYHEQTPGYRELFKDAGTMATSSEFQLNLLRVLRENKVEFFKAPYMAWAQMAYWCQDGRDRGVHQIQGPNELIMFEHVEVLILDFHFDRSPQRFDYIIKSEIKRALIAGAPPPISPLTDSQFLDCCLLTGLKGQIKHPKHFSQVQFVKIAQTLQKFGNACDFIMSKPTVDGGPTNQQLAKNHMRIRAVIRHSVVFTLDGQCLPMTHAMARHCRHGEEPEKVPCNLSDLWGHRLPNILYFFLSIGAIQTQVLINVVQNQMIETIPQLDTEEYRVLLGRILPLRTQVAHQVIHQLGERDEKYFIRGPMSCWRWFLDQQAPILQPPPIKLDEWGVEHSQIRQYLMDQKIDFLFVVKHFSMNAHKLTQYKTFEEVLCAIHLKALDLLGYFTHATHAASGAEPTSGQSIYSESLQLAGKPHFAEHTVLLIELLRTKSLTSRHFTYVRPEPTGPESAGDATYRSLDPWESGTRTTRHFPPLKLPPVYLEQDLQTQATYEECCLLASRIWSLINMDLKEEPWDSDVSKDLLAFNTVVKALHKTLRNLVEVIAAVLFLEGRTTIDPYHYCDLPANLPFAQESNTAMGIVIDYIMRSSEDFGDPAINSRRTRLAHLQQQFPCCNDIAGDLARGFEFWLCVITLLDELQREPGTVTKGLQDIFPSADMMLRVKLERVIPLGEHCAEDDQYQDPEE
eukprot:TRINITY_DN209_c0_g1_i1.p1 TRINITY_DN209_c0_g1~~TRINITY_DN209_c0_g1_i1.p1  ORF type:complete len:832 (+),score=327.99 TRINITY_DN209_c0_g1_i1:97-2496(+)